MTYSNSWYKKEYLLGLGGLGGGAGGILVAGGPIATGEDAYQIKKSLRFNDDDTAYLQRQITNDGNKNTWTFAAWIKHHARPSSESVNVKWLTASYQSQLQLLDGGTLLINFLGNTHKLQTNRVFRDPSAWFHLVVTCDTTQPNSLAAERLRVYINGRQETSFSTETYPDRSDTADWLKSGENLWIGKAHDAGQYGDGYIADVYMVDGLVLTPASFGSFDSTGAFNPKAFTLPAPNDNTTWSSAITYGGQSFKSGSEGTKGFDGLLTTRIRTNASSNNGLITFTPATPISYTTSIRAYNGTGSATMSSATWSLNSGAAQSVSSEGWIDIATGSGTLTSLSATRNGDGEYFSAIEVDGVILYDGQTDSTTRNNPNDGRVFSDGISGGAWSGYPVTQAFNGELQNGHIPPAGGSSTITFSPAIPVNKKVEFYIQFDGSYGNVVVNGTTVNSQLKYNSWCSIQGISWPLSTISYSAPGGSDYVTMRGIKVDGHMLIDSTVDNSFHLNFEDASQNSALGKDTLNGKIEDATGGLPIYNTKAGATDNEIDYGNVKDTGYRTDSSAGTTDGAGLVFAMPGDTLTDIHASINTGSSNNTITTWYAGLTSSTDDSRFYGSSIKLDGTGVLQTNNTTDFIFGTGAWCIEMWVKNTSSTDDRGFFHLSGDSGWAAGNGFAFFWHQNKWKFRVNGGGGDKQVESSSTAVINRWYHIALTYDGTDALKFYIDGRLEDTETQAYNFVSGAGDGGYINIGGYYGASYRGTGYLQDIRIYKGTAKYTANFKPPTRNDFVVNNLENKMSASSDTDYVSGATLGASTLGYTYMLPLIFDGSTATEYVDRPSANNYVAFSNLPTASSSVQVYAYTQSGNLWYKKDGDSSATAFSSSSAQWHDLGTGKLVNVGASNGSGSDGFGIKAIKVDGTVLTYYPPADCDSLTDTPTNYLPEDGDDSLGGVTRGNYATLNPLDNNGLILKQGNLEVSYNSNSWKGVRGNFGLTSGKWYFEATLRGQVPDGSNGYYIGVGTQDCSLTAPLQSEQYIRQNTIRWSHDTNTSFYSASSLHDVHGVAIDMDNKKMWISDNNTWQGSGNPATGANSHFTIVHDEVLPLAFIYGSVIKLELNFGARPYKYAAPTGFKSLCTSNLDDTFSGDDVNNPSKFFDIIARNGFGTAGGSVDGLGFQPDLIWDKVRSIAGGNQLHDAIRGPSKMLKADQDNPEGTDANYLSSFDSNGLTFGTGDYATNRTVVEFCWDAGTAASGANTNGTINIADGNQWVNDDAGFSMTKFTSTGSSGATVGHGLSAAPDFMLIKSIDDTGDWGVYHKSIGLPATTDGGLVLNTTASVNTASDWWASTNPTSTVFSLGNKDTVNPSGAKPMMAYCWRSISGYSAFGSYLGNDLNPGPFIYTGFKPRWIMIKNKDAGGSSYTKDWHIYDTERDSFNEVTKVLFANTNAGGNTYDASSDARPIDIVSNGFTIRESDSNINTAIRYVYAAFAEHPYKTARAR